MSYRTLVEVETLIIAIIGVGAILIWVRRRLERFRPGLSIARPLFVAFWLRLAAMAGVSATGIGTQLRGGDEIGFLAQAHQIAATGWFSGPWTPMFSKTGSNNLHEILFAIQIKALDFGPGALRVTQIGLALAGLLLIVAAVYDLGGPRAARLTAWLGAIEPSSVFFSSTLLKESLLYFAVGLVIFGGARLWRRFDLSGLLWMGAGCLTALFDRGYVGIFLSAGCVLLLLHVSGRNLRRRTQAIPVLLGVLLLAALMSPIMIRLSDPGTLKTFLQGSQNANTLVTPAPSALQDVGKPNGDNLALAPVNFTSRKEIIIHLPQRTFDLLVKPYPWQHYDWSQRFGAIGSLLALALLAALIRYAWRSRGSILNRTAPLLYPSLMLLIAYSLSVGNAGTGFRYRSHLLIPAIGMLSILWAASRAAVPARAGGASRRGLPYPQPWPVISSAASSPVTSAVARKANA
jgi:hypothetical protein